MYLSNNRAAIDNDGKLWFECGCNCKFAFKRINIGDWNMDITETVSIAHGLTLANIISCFCSVINDAADKVYQSMGHDGGTIPLQIDYCDATNIVLTRKAGSIFDSVDFDSTPYNRGYIMILHKE